ncbi:hypothetical protein ACLB2K_037738 [Fragaria x ananassa]
MGPRKRAADVSLVNRQEQQQECQPKGPCRFQHLPWLSIISDPHFSLMRLSKSPTIDYTQIVESDGPHFHLEKMRFSTKTGLPPLSDLIPFWVNSLLFRLLRRGGFYAIPSSDLVIALQPRHISIGKTPKDSAQLAPFNAELHGALHWLSFGGGTFQFVHAFNFATEEFLTLPPPGYFEPIEMQFKECLKLGVFGGCLFLCVCGDDPSQFDMWVLKEYGVQESWTKSLVVEGLYRPELDNDVYEPLVFLRNGDILLCYNDWLVVCYNQGTKSLKETRVARPQYFRAIGYNPCFFSLHDVAKGEEIKRVRDKRNPKKAFGEGSSGCVNSGIPQKSKKRNSGNGLPAWRVFLDPHIPVSNQTSYQMIFLCHLSIACSVNVVVVLKAL